MKRVWKVVGVAVGLGLIVVLCLPIFSSTAVRGAQTANLSRAKQLAFGVQLYAQDHEGRFPIHLRELVPDCIPAESWTGLFYAHGSEEPAKPQYDWLYFGALLDEKAEKTVLIASPQALTNGKPRKRIVAYSDFTALVVSEEQYQADLQRYLIAVRARLPAVQK